MVKGAAPTRRPLQMRSVKRKAVPASLTPTKVTPSASLKVTPSALLKATPSASLKGTPPAALTPSKATTPATVTAAEGDVKGAAASQLDCIQGRLLGDGIVTVALAEILGLKEGEVRLMMRKWEKPILKVPIPGTGGRVPCKAMLAEAKAAVIGFFENEEALGPRGHVSKAFYLASREGDLTFAWSRAKQRVKRAKLDSRGRIDSWKDCLAMVSGDSNTKSEIYVCGTRKVTLSALTSLICHEGLHNLARRTRRGNPFLGEDTEHIAMALIGDPQLAA